MLYPHLGCMKLQLSKSTILNKPPAPLPRSIQESLVITLGEALCLGSSFDHIATNVQGKDLSWSDAVTNEGYFLPSRVTTADTLHIIV